MRTGATRSIRNGDLHGEGRGLSSRQPLATRSKTDARSSQPSPKSTPPAPRPAGVRRRSANRAAWPEHGLARARPWRLRRNICSGGGRSTGSAIHDPCRLARDRPPSAPLAGDASWLDRRAGGTCRPAWSRTPSPPPRSANRRGSRSASPRSASSTCTPSRAPGARVAATSSSRGSSATSGLRVEVDRAPEAGHPLTAGLHRAI